MCAHYLVVGGTGMLSGLVGKLINDGELVSILSRDERSFLTLKNKFNSDNLFHIKCDYGDADNTKVCLKKHAEKVGLFDFSICWVHEPFEMETCSLVARYTLNTIWQVVGSSAVDPSNPNILQGAINYFSKFHPSTDYRIIVLGFVNNKLKSLGFSRWLTDLEISDGVFSAIGNDNTLNIVGTTTPWSSRPAF